MTPHICEQLDAWLLCDLDPEEAMAFEQHLLSCPACQTIQIRAATLAQSVPMERMRQRIRQVKPQIDEVQSVAKTRSSNRHIAAVCAAVMTLAICLLLIVSTPDVSNENGIPRARTGHSMSSVMDTVNSPPIVRLADGLIGVPVDSSDSNVTILLVYQSQRKQSLQNDTMQRAESLHTNDGDQVAGHVISPLKPSNTQDSTLIMTSFKETGR